MSSSFTPNRDVERARPTRAEVQLRFRDLWRYSRRNFRAPTVLSQDLRLGRCVLTLRAYRPPLLRLQRFCEEGRSAPGTDSPGNQPQKRLPGLGCQAGRLEEVRDLFGSCYGSLQRNG